MFKQKIRSVLIAGSLVLGTLGILIFSPAASAVPPHDPMLDLSPFNGDKWEVRAFDDPNPAHNFLTSFEVCFQYQGNVGMQGEYIWWTLSPPFLYGIARKEGDQVFMHGVGVTSIQDIYAHWEVVSQNEGAGHFRYWYWQQPPAVSGFTDVNATFLRNGGC